jgi:hypothetical protein
MSDERQERPTRKVKQRVRTETTDAVSASSSSDDGIDLTLTGDAARALRETARLLVPGGVSVERALASMLGSQLGLLQLLRLRHAHLFADVDGRLVSLAVGVPDVPHGSSSTRVH